MLILQDCVWPRGSATTSLHSTTQYIIPTLPLNDLYPKKFNKHSLYQQAIVQWSALP